MVTMLAELGLKTSPKSDSFALQRVEEKPSTALNIMEQIALNHAYRLDPNFSYLLFKHSEECESLHIAAYVIDNEDAHLTDIEIAQVYRKFWLDASAPLLYVGWKDRVDIFSCSQKPVKINNHWKYDPVESILAADKGLKEQKKKTFSSHSILDGTFWDDPKNAERFSKQEGFSHKLLIDKVKYFYKSCSDDYQHIHRLIIQTILIKYLEDKKVFSSGGAWFSRFMPTAESLLDILQRGTSEQFLKLLKELEAKFNGGIFSIDANCVDENVLRKLADLANSKLDKHDQLSLWELYSFEYVPVEVISQLYQLFARKDNGSVYTPVQLVNLILDYSMPISTLGSHVRVLDPTCGSGVFLVSAFKRICLAMRQRNNWEPLSLKEYRGVLEDCIYGVDSESVVVELTAFSLALALCDALQPDVIWKQLKFNDLEEKQNLIVSDFFEAIELLKKRLPSGFTHVIGNPPFKSKLSDKQLKTVGNVIPDRQLAYGIAQASLGLLCEGGTLAMIQNAGFLYNSGTANFRTSFFQTCQINTILDFASIRGEIFTADTKIIVLIATKHQPSEKNSIHHHIFRRTNNVHNRLVFELDYYDQHEVDQSTAEKFPWVWRINLLGGGRLFDLAQRLKSFPSLETNVKQHEWQIGEGFVIGKTVARKTVPWLYDKSCVSIDGITDSGVDIGKIYPIKERNFRSTGGEIRYTPPMILITKNTDLKIAHWEQQKGFLAYNSDIVGINAPAADAASLKHFYEFLLKNKRYISALIQVFSTKTIINRNTTPLTSDIASLPCPGNGDFLFSQWERILLDDVDQYITDYALKGYKSKLLLRSASSRDFDNYTSYFLKLLSSVYPDLHAGERFSSNGLSGQAFFFGKTIESSLLNKCDFSTLSSIIYSEQGKSLINWRILRIFDGNAFIIIKPDRLRYWIRSVAIRDSDDILACLVDQGF